jgi:mannosyltransferase
VNTARARPETEHGTVPGLASTNPGRRELAALALLVAAAAAIRFATLSVQSAWLDEALALIHIHRSFGAMVSVVDRTETSPPLYFALAWLWSHVFGGGVVAIRAFSALLGVVTIPLLYVAARPFGQAAGLWAAALGAASAEMLYYSQEARPYALFVCLTLAAFVAWQRRRLHWWVGISILALWTHYFSGFLFIGEAAVLIWRLPAGRRDWRPLIAPFCLYAAAAAIVARIAVHQATSGSSFWIENESLAGRLAKTVKEFLVGPYGPWGRVAAPLAAVLVAAIAAALLRLHRREDRTALIDIAAAAAISVALPLILAITRIEDVFDPRNVLMAWGPIAVLAAVGLAAFPRPVWGFGLGFGLLAVWGAVIAGTVVMPAYQRDDWRGAARSLGPAPPGGRVIVAGRYGVAPLSVYLAHLNLLNAGVHSIFTREIDFIFLRHAHAGPWENGEDSIRPPIPPGRPSAAPPALFDLSAVHRSSAYATYIYVARVAAPVTPSELEREFGGDRLDIITAP